MEENNQNNVILPKLLIWCCDTPPPTGNWTNVLWQNFSSCPQEISIPYLVEKHSDKLKNKLLTWIYDLGETKINKKRIVIHQL